MEDTGHTFLNRKEEVPTTTTMPLNLVDAMANKLFTIASPPMEPMRRITNIIATTP